MRGHGRFSQTWSHLFSCMHVLINLSLYTYIHIRIYVPSSSSLKTKALGISIIGVMLPNTEETLDVLFTLGN